MMRSMCLLFMLTITFQVLSAQDGSNQDPQAKKILQKLSKEYKAYTTMEVSFNLILDLPEQASETQQGKVIQKGDKYVLDLKDQAIYCNGKYVWLHLKDNNEVQINDLDEDEEDSFLTPKDMMTIYESDDYNYAVIGTQKKGKLTFTQIEFKPTDPDAEYSKLRLSVDTKNNKMASMEVFSKDGSKYTLTVDKIFSNKDYADVLFAFDASKFPGIHIEDLRL